MSPWYKFGDENRPDQKTPISVLESYIDPDHRIGTLVELQCQNQATTETDTFRVLHSKLCRHVAERNPKYILFSEITQETIDRETANQIAVQLELGKPQRIAEKLAEHKATANLRAECLMEQSYSKMTTVNELMKETIAKLGEFLRIGGFVRYDVESDG